MAEESEISLQERTNPGGEMKEAEKARQVSTGECEERGFGPGQWERRRKMT